MIMVEPVGEAHIDDVIQALMAEAAADPDVIGLVLLGSRAIGTETAESDYDLIFMVTDAAAARYEQTKSEPKRGVNLPRPIDTVDIWNDTPSGLRVENVISWMLPTFAEAKVIYDRTGEAARVIDALRQMPAEMARKEIEDGYGTYLNKLYRSLKCWRRGNELGGRMEAAETADALVRALFALEGHWRPYSSRLVYHLDRLAGQGWQPGELRESLLDLIGTGNPQRQQCLARKVVPLFRERGYGHVYDEWNGRIDKILGWDFS